jgi:hypothetical protein
MAINAVSSIWAQKFALIIVSFVSTSTADINDVIAKLVHPRNENVERFFKEFATLSNTLSVKLSLLLSTDSFSIVLHPVKNLPSPSGEVRQHPFRSKDNKRGQFCLIDSNAKSST